MFTNRLFQGSSESFIVMKNIVITGSTRGIGLGLAKKFLEQGHAVTLNGSSQDRIDEALSVLSSYSGRVQGVVGTVADRDAMARLFHFSSNRFGCVDIWVNNAGISHTLKKVWELDDDTVRNVLDVNLRGVINGTVIAFNGMSRQGRGKIFNMEGHGSGGSIIDRMSIYGTSKSAVHYFTKAFSQEAKGSGVQIGVLSPGMVITGMLLQEYEGVVGAEEPSLRNGQELDQLVELLLGGEQQPFIAHNVLGAASLHPPGDIGRELAFAQAFDVQADSLP